MDQAQVQQILGFDKTPEGHYTDYRSRDVLRELYDGTTDDVRQLLSNQPISAADYVNRFVFWVQAIKGRDPEEQYNIVHQLIRAYATHATMTDYHMSYRLVPDVAGDAS